MDYPPKEFFFAATHPGGDAPTKDALNGAGVKIPEYLGGEAEVSVTVTLTEFGNPRWLMFV